MPNANPPFSAPQLRGIFRALILLLLWSHPTLAADFLAPPAIDAPVPAPDFTLATLGGGETRLADYKGKVILLNFWATWCEPCRQEMPALEAVWQKYRKRGLTVLSVSEDSDSGKRVARFAAKLGLTFPILLDPDGEVGKRYKASALPVTYLIDRNGNIIGTVLGSANWAHPKTESLLIPILDNTWHDTSGPIINN